MRQPDTSNPLSLSPFPTQAAGGEKLPRNQESLSRFFRSAPPASSSAPTPPSAVAGFRGSLFVSTGSRSPCFISIEVSSRSSRTAAAAGLSGCRS